MKLAAIPCYESWLLQILLPQIMPALNDWLITLQEWKQLYNIIEDTLGAMGYEFDASAISTK